VVRLNSEEVLPEVPAAPHDRRVDAVATELGLTRLGGMA
jgi:5-formyltetrahydrofolate cyclo-ligase